jgi:hypothetical protein
LKLYIYNFHLQKQSNADHLTFTTKKINTIDLNSKFQENLDILLSLIKKFTIKIKGFFDIYLSSQTNNMNKEMIEDLKETFKNFISLVNNPNLVTDLCDSNVYNPLKETSFINQFSLTTMFYNLEKVIEELQRKNEVFDKEREVR